MAKKKLYIDLFAGCGGLSLGLYNSTHWKGLFAIEKSKDAFATLKYNLIDKKAHFKWPDWLPIQNHDISCVIKEYRSELYKLKGKVDLVVGGPPCQGFSTAGKRQESDKRNTMMHHYLEFVNIIKPKALFFENVKGFDIGFKQEDGSRGVPYSKHLIQGLKDIGFNSVSGRLLDFSEYAIPQQRKRFIVVATMVGDADDFFDSLKRNREHFCKSKNIPKRVSVADAISDIERFHGVVASPDSKGFMNGKYSPVDDSHYQRLMRKDSPHKIPDSHRFSNHKEATIKKFEDIIENALTSKQVARKYNTKKTSTSLLKPSSPSLTLTTLPDDYVHYSEPRILTIREYARIQSFPDWYEFKGKYTTGGKMRKLEVPRYTQVGNAIPPLFGEQCGVALGKLLKENSGIL